LKLLAAHPFLGRAEKVDRVNPLMEGKLGILENGAYGHAELRTAVATEQEARTVRLALKAANALYAATVRAFRAFRPAGSFQMGAGGILVMEAGFGVGCGAFGLFGHGLAFL